MFSRLVHLWRRFYSRAYGRFFDWKWDLYGRDLNNLKAWHERYEGEVYCPFCGVPSVKVKTNGKGFYRCKGKCENRFFLMRCIE